ncbi:MAG: hypothetical protein MUO60_08570, partial [Clostridiaceae bacterium]|nr:hypothetical protein [Clostridiaceae bacterium]
MKKLIYLLILSSFIGARFLSIEISVFQLSLYRIIIVLIPFLVIYQSKKKSMKILPTNEKSRAIVLFYVFWVVYSLLTVFWVKDYYEWGRAVYFITAGMIGIIGISMFIKEEEDFITVFNIIQIMLIIHNVIGWFDIMSIRYTYLNYPRLDYFIWLIKLGRHPVSIMGNTNNFALLLTLGVFISFICYKNSRSKLWRAVNIASIGSCIVLIFMTESRANLLGLIMALGVFVLLNLIKKKKIKKFLFISISITIVFAIFAAIGMPSVYQKILSALNKVLYFDFNATD